MTWTSLTWGGTTVAGSTVIGCVWLVRAPLSPANAHLAPAQRVEYSEKVAGVLGGTNTAQPETKKG
jgi:hypothetical protein